jgi:uncharacterized protein YdeI (BOF family)
MIRVEIDDDDMPKGLAVGQLVQIDGEIDTSFWSKRDVEIDVDTVRAI